MKEVIVITDSVESFERYCMETGHDRTNAHQVTQPFQLAMYPDAEIVYYGEYGKNACYGCKELEDHKAAQAQRELEDFMKKDKEKANEA